MADGDTVIFTDGTYDINGPIVIRHTDLTISSDDGDGVLIRSLDNKGLVFRNHGDVSGLEIRGFSMASAETTRLAPARNFAMVFVEHTAGLDDIKILDNTFRGFKQNGVRIGSSDQSSLFTNVEIRDNTFETIPDDRYPVHISNAEVTLFANSFERSNYVHRDGDGSLIDLYNVYPGKPDRAPVVTAPPPVDLEATGPQTAVTPEQLGTATARDDRDQSPVISNDSPGSFAVGNHTVTWTATDSTGNSGTATQTVTIRDTTPPAITLIGDSSVTVEQDGTYKELSATCTDLVDGSLSITTNGAVDTSTPGEYTLKYSCTDAAGNPSSVTRTVTVMTPLNLPQPTDLGVIERDLSGGWRMMTINWTEPRQPPASGYEVTVTGSNGTLLPLSQFGIFVADNERSSPSFFASYNMDGSRNPQGDIVYITGEATWGLDMHDNVIYTNPNNGTVVSYNLDGTLNQTITTGSTRGEGLAIHDGKAWMYDLVGGDWYVLSFDLSTGNSAGTFALHHEITNPVSIGELDGILYVVDNSRDKVYAHETDGTYIWHKSFKTQSEDPWGIDAEDITGTLWVYDTASPHTVHVYSHTSGGGTPRLFSLDIERPSLFTPEHIVLTTPVTSDTITVPTGTNSTTYYYYAPANEDVTHTVRSAGPSTDPPATITTIFYDTSDFGTWTYQEHPYYPFNTFCEEEEWDPHDTNPYAYFMVRSSFSDLVYLRHDASCWFGLVGMSKTFDVPAGYGGGNLTISLDYGIYVDFDNNQTTDDRVINMFYAVTDSDGNNLDKGLLFPGGQNMTGRGASWNTATISVPSLAAASCPCEIGVYTADLGWNVFKLILIDNVHATMTRP